MKSFSQKAICTCIFSFLNCGFVFSQIIDFSSENPYRQVFMETDNFGASYLKTLEDAYPKAKNDSIQFSILNDLAYYWHTRNLVKAMDFTKKGLLLTLEKKDTLWEGRFQATQAAILLRMEQLDSAETLLNLAMEKVLPTDLAFLNTQLGYVNERRGLLDIAADYAIKALKLGVKHHDQKAIALAYSDLGNLFWKQGKFETGLEYGLKSLEVFEERGITDLYYDISLYVVGNNYLGLKKFEKAKHYFERSMVIGERYGFYNNLSDVYISLVDLYAHLNNFEKAEIASENAMKYAKFLDNNFMLMRCWLSIGKKQRLQGNFSTAIASLKKCIHIATADFGDEYYLSEAYSVLGKAYAANHQYEEAYKALATYETYKNKIFTAEADQRTSLIKTEFDFANKENIILTQESLIQKQRTWQISVTIIAGLLLILLLLAYRAIQSKFRSNQMLQKGNKEKEFLLKEMHHRVKNNLDTVSGLLSLQSAQIKDLDLLNALQESQHRVNSIGMIHKKLYVGENLAVIGMKEYFIELADYIVNAFGAQANVVVDVNMKNIELDVDVAMPIGLIVNELLTNSIKYAFPRKGNGLIEISLRENKNMWSLEVTDNGIGDALETEAKGTGFGSKLIALLTKQLDGNMVLNTSKGTSVSIQFYYQKAA